MLSYFSLYHRFLRNTILVGRKSALQATIFMGVFYGNLHNARFLFAVTLVF